MRSLSPCLCGDPECRACFPSSARVKLRPTNCKRCGRWHTEPSAWCEPCACKLEDEAAEYYGSEPIAVHAKGAPGATGVVELDPTDPRATVCGNCGRGWDDSVATSWTPVPSGRCPFEYEHEYEHETEDDE